MKPTAPTPPDLAAIRVQLAGARGRDYWRTLDEVAQTPEFQNFLHREFSPEASQWNDAPSRRTFLKLMGASLALSGLTACTRQPIAEIVPYVKQPEELIPGQPLWFATAREHDGFATGLLAESHEGHPTKIEGNPEHPASLGATTIFDQAAILDLYDPERSRALLNAGQPSTWPAFLSAINTAMAAQQTSQGAGLRILSGTVTSPTLAAQIQTLLAQFPAAKWIQYQPVSRDNVLAGSQLAFGEIVEAHYHFEQADVILSLDANFLATQPDSLRHVREFTHRRRATAEKQNPNRLYVIEPSPTITGAMADHRLPVRSIDVESFARELLRQIQSPGASAKNDAHSLWLNAVARELLAHRGTSLIIAGDSQPPAVHALAHILNDLLGNVGHTVTYTESAAAAPSVQLPALRGLCDDLTVDRVELLVILGGNPAYAAPADFHFAEAAARAKICVQLSLDQNETSALAHWHIPQTHFLEAWSDTRAFDGTTSIVQPLILPLYDGKSAHEVIAALAQTTVPANYDLVRAHWQSRELWPDFEKGWRRAVHDGLIAGTQLPVKAVALKISAADSLNSPEPVSPSTREISFSPDPCVWDGRFANNGWLQELPKPITKLTWDNAALISPALAEAEHLANGDMIELHCEGRTLSAPVWIVPGQADQAITLHLGYGRTRVGSVGTDAGFNAYKLRTSTTMGFGSLASLAKTGKTYQLVSTQDQHSIQGRDILFAGTFAQYKSDPNFLPHRAKQPPREETLFDPAEYKNDDYQWGMSIDLTACIGCNACAIACQAENNIPIVGKPQVAMGRVMHWIRIDSYFRGGLQNPEITHQPVPCMHCENAPCELVCPVGATVTDHEGLNLQVYNRCVGTRYCSNNCPYKVRRFNFLQYTDETTPSLKPLRNPNVSVRSRGVMEKCTFCIQRISAARINAQEKNRPIRDGELVTACQQACPAQAIVFGDIHDPRSRVAQVKKSMLDFSMLAELNTRPRTTYLAKLRNPNPELDASPA